MTQQKSKKKMAERRAQRRRQSQVRLIAGISLTAVLLVGIIAFLTLVSSPEPSDYADLFQEIDRSGAPGIALGESSAPVTLVEYSDFSCSHCETLSATINTLISEYVTDGRLRVVYKPVSFISPQYSEPASRAAICAAEQGKGWQMMDFIWGLSGPASYSLENFARIDTNVGLDIESFRQCFAGEEASQAVQAVNDEAFDKGISGTPTLFVNDAPVQATEDALKRAIESALGS